MGSVPVHPEYGKPLSGKPKVCEGVTFRPYRTGIARASWFSDDFRIQIHLPFGRSLLMISIDGASIPVRRRTILEAAQVAVSREECRNEPQGKDHA